MTLTSASLDLDLVRAEWGRPADGSIYFNTGSCGRKPQCVLQSMSAGWEQLNLNPTLFTFQGEEGLQAARQVLAEVLKVSGENLLLTQNTTQGLQMVLQSFLLKPGDELVTTTHEHSSLVSIARHLEETRGIVVRRHDAMPLQGSDALCQGLLAQVSDRTCLVQVSEIDCFSGWRPNLKPLADELARRNIPLLVDGAHVPGQGVCGVSKYPLWVGSGHKWLGGPNGTGMLVAQSKWIERLKPTWVGDRFYQSFENPIRRFEYQGTADAVRWQALAAAGQLHLKLNPDAIAQRQRELVVHLRRRLEELPGATIQTPDVIGEDTGLLTVNWKSDRVKTANIQKTLWDEHRMWVQPDYFYGDIGHGMRVSCHISIELADIDNLISKVALLIK